MAVCKSLVLSWLNGLGFIIKDHPFKNYFPWTNCDCSEGIYMADKAALGKHLYNMYFHWTRTELLLGRVSDTPSWALSAESDLYEFGASAGKQTQMESRHVWKAAGWVDLMVTQMQSEGN